MAPRFCVPKCLEDLMEPPSDDEDRLYARDVTDVDSLDATEIHRLVAGLATELANKEVLCVEEQSVFDQLYSLVRGYTFLDVSPKSVLIDSLCTNFVQLNVSTSILIKSIEDSPEDDIEDVVQQSRSHCNAIKIYAYFLFSILMAEEAEPESSATGSTSSGSRGGSKGRSRKKHVPQDWDWSSLRTRTLRVLAGALQNDLKNIFESPQLDDSLISFLAKAAFKVLENKALLERADCKQPLCTIISACTIQYGYGISSVVTIIDMLHKFDHLPAHIADLVSLAENQYSSSSSLAVDLLRAIGKIDPTNFERDSAGADNVGLFLEELATRLPKTMVTNLSVILCHLDGKSYKMRNSLVKVIGKLLVGAIKNLDGNANPSDVTRLRTEQCLLNILVERSRDISAHTRKHVLQTWAYLCKERAVPIGHWNLVSDLAAGRLEDSAAIVRKNALQLLATLLEFNPFGPSLRAAAFEATYEKYKEKLSVMSPPNEKDGEEPGQNLEEMERDFSAEQESGAAPTSTADGQSSPNVGKEAHSQPDHDLPPHDQQPSSDSQISTEIGGLEHTRALVASLESALRFSKCLGSTMDTLSQLLASSTTGDVVYTIQLLILCKKFEVDGAGACIRKTLPLVFSQQQDDSGSIVPSDSQGKKASGNNPPLQPAKKEAGIAAAVEEAFKTLYLKGTSSEVASNLISLTLEATLGDLASIEALVSKSMSRREISSGTVSALWDFFTFNVPGSTADQSRAALTVLCMAAKSNPQILSTHLQNILDIGFGRWAKDDVLLARCACIALQRLPDNDRESFRRTHKIFSILSNLIVRPGLSEACWYSAAEQAINAIYALHPAPESFSSGLLMKFAQSVFSSAQRSTSRGLDNEDTDVEDQFHDFSSVSGVAVSRFLFAVAHVALKHLVYIESRLKLIRKHRSDKENVAANNAAEESVADVGVTASKDGNIAAELGLAASEDAMLDDLADQAETEIIGGDMTQTFLLGAIAPLVTRLCSNSTLMQKNQQLRSSALLALCKLMVIDANFCEKHLQLLFTVAQNSPEDSVRSNCVVALGDIALRFPNLLEPWMESMYARVHDKSKSVRKNTVLVLSHLILNDLIKVKGYISEMAMHLEDEEPRISDLVKLFFHELSKKGNNSINNLLPDILSRLSSNPDLSQDHFNLIMQFLIGTIKKSKQVEGLIEKFCNRFVGTSDARQWQDIAFCLCQLSYTQSCLKRLADVFKLYQHALGDAGVFGYFKSLIVKTRKLATADLKLALDELEEKIMNCHNEKKEQEEAFQKAQEHHLRTEALKAQSAGENNVNKIAQDDELETLATDSVAEREEGEATSLDTPSTVKEEPFEEVVPREGDGMSLDMPSIVKEEPIEEVVPRQEGSTLIQSNDVEGYDGYRAEIEATTSESVPVQHEAGGDVARSVDEVGTQLAQLSVENVDDEDSTVLNPVENVGVENSGNLNRADVKRMSNRQGRTLTKGFKPVRVKAEIEAYPVLEKSAEVSEIASSEEDTPGTQPYPYMDLDLESALTPESPKYPTNDRAVRLKPESDAERDAGRRNETEVEEDQLGGEETIDESVDICGISPNVVNDEYQYNVKENPDLGGPGSDRDNWTSSILNSTPPSLESPQAARTKPLTRKVGVNPPKAMKSFPKVKEERSPQHERVAGKSRALKPRNGMA